MSAMTEVDHQVLDVWTQLIYPHAPGPMEIAVIANLVQRFGDQLVADSMISAAKSYLCYVDGLCIPESIDHATEMLERICYISRRAGWDPYAREVAMLGGTLRQHGYCGLPALKGYVREALAAGVRPEDIRRQIFESRSAGDFIRRIANLKITARESNILPLADAELADSSQTDLTIDTPTAGDGDASNVYMLRHLSEPRVKIGYSRDPVTRSIALPEPIDFSRSFVVPVHRDYAHRLERDFHRVCNKYRIEVEGRGDGYTEWFSLDAIPVLLAYVSRRQYMFGAVFRALAGPAVVEVTRWKSHEFYKIVSSP